MSARALLVIDVQKLYTLPNSELYVEGAKEIISNINDLVSQFNKSGDPIIYVRHIHSADGSDSGRMWDFTGEQEEIGFLDGTPEVEYDDDLLRISDGKEIIKHRYSAFEGTELLKQLREKDVTRVTIVGFMANFCCEATARAAHDKDFYVDFIEDATGCPDIDDINQEQIKKALCATLSSGYANVLATSEYLKKDGK